MILSSSYFCLSTFIRDKIKMVTNQFKMYIILATAYLFCAQNIPELAVITIMSSEATGASALSKSFMNLFFVTTFYLAPCALV